MNLKPDRQALVRSLNRGLQFLSSARTSAGWWTDFRTSEGISDEWVTAYVGARLAEMSHPPARRLAEEAWHRLARRRWWLPGWSYNYRVPLDADSTIWAVRLAERLEVDSQRIRKAFGFLRAHTHPGGGLATYAPKSRIHRHIGLPFKESAAGWYAPQPCVSAAAAGLENWPDRPALFAFLAERQSDTGSWEGYWWSDPEYPTWLAAAAFRRFPHAHGDDRPLKAACAWSRSRIAGGPVRTDYSPAGSAFATACALVVIAGSPDAAANRSLLHPAAAWLIAAQNIDGSWPSSARLRLPPPAVYNAGEVSTWRLTDEVDAASIKLDHHRVYTTATVAAALDSLSGIIGDA